MGQAHLGRLGIILLIAAVGVVAGCSDSPLSHEQGAHRADNEATVLDLLQIEESDIDGVDLNAITRALDNDAIAEAVDAIDRNHQPSFAKAGFVQPGESIQDAVDASPAGGTVFVRPGTYVETITIEKPLHLVGLGAPGSVVIQDPGDERNGIVARDVSGISLINLTVRGFSGNGVFIVGVDGFLFFRLITDQLGTGAYGLFPVRSSNGLIAHCLATGADDAGIYVGQSENVAVVHNETYGNVIGLEAENVRQTVWAHNRSYDNAAGMLAILLPEDGRYISITYADQLEVAHNRFTDNNGANFAEEGSLASFVPSGTGLLIIGFDDSIVHRNRVTGNSFIGIGLGSVLTMLQIAGRLPDDPTQLGIDPHPDNVRIVHNRVTGNGTAPSFLPLPPVDLFWDRPLHDTYGTGNCWEDNTYATSFPDDLPSCG